MKIVVTAINMECVSVKIVGTPKEEPRKHCVFNWPRRGCCWRWMKGTESVCSASLSLSLLILWIISSMGRSALSQTTLAEPDALTATREAYSKIAGDVAKSLGDGGSSSSHAGDVAVFIAAMKGELLDMQGIGSVEPALKMIAADEAQAVQMTLNAMATLRSAPQPPGELNQLLRYVYYGATTQFGAAEEYENRIQNQSATIRDAWLQIIEAINRSEAASLMLPRVAKKIAGPMRSGSYLVDVDVDEAWGFFAADLIHLRNSSRQTLHNCTVVVTLFGRAGDSHQNVHFVKLWGDGQTLHASYDSGHNVLGQRVFRETVTGIQRATVTLYADELSAEDIPYRYAGDERERDIGRYLDKHFKVHSSYQPYSKGLVFDDQRTVLVWFDGLQYLPSGTLRLMLKNEERNTTGQRTFSRWNSGQKQGIEFKEIPWDPKEWIIQFQFDDTRVTRTYSTTR